MWRDITAAYLIGFELFSVHRCRVLNHYQCVISKTLTVEVLGVGKIVLLPYCTAHTAHTFCV